MIFSFNLLRNQKDTKHNLRLKVIFLLLSYSIGGCNPSKKKTGKIITQDSTNIINLFSKTKISKDSSYFFIKQAEKIVADNKSVTCKALFLSLCGREFIYKGKLDSAKYIAEEGLQLNYDSSNIVLKGKFYNIKGQAEGLSKNIYKSIDYYLSAETFFAIGKDSAALAGIYSNIANSFFSLKDYETAHGFARKAYTLKNTIRENYIKANVLSTYAISLIKTKHNKEALCIVMEADSLATATNNIMAKLASAIGFAEVHKSLHNYDTSRYFYNNCIALSKKAGVKHFELISKIGLLSINEELKNTNKITLEADSLLLLASKMNNIDVLHTSKRIIGRAFAAQNNFKKGFQHLNESYNLYDSVAGIENQKNINEILVKYGTQKKENEILNQNYLLEKQKNSLRKRQIIIVVLLIGILTLVVLIWYVKKLHLEKLKRFELENQKIITDAYIIGEEKERERISFEIHDGVAGMITALILKMQSERYQKEEFVLILQQLHEDSRRISHNLMPIDFENKTLVSAIENLCYKTSSYKVDVSFLCVEKMINLDYQKSALLYRIIQELINNAIKHSNCKTVFVTIELANKVLKTTVQDDGVGITDASLSKGLRSIKERLKALKGLITITSSQNEGTRIIITHDC